MDLSDQVRYLQPAAGPDFFLTERRKDELMRAFRTHVRETGGTCVLRDTQQNRYFGIHTHTGGAERCLCRRCYLFHCSFSFLCTFLHIYILQVKNVLWTPRRPHARPRQPLNRLEPNLEGDSLCRKEF